MTNYMKFAVRILPVLAAVLIAAPASAATLSLSPTAVSVVRGQTVTVQVLVNAGGAQTVTAAAHLSYPSSMLTATSFTFAPNWMQLSQPGYDSMGGGTIIKTAGYPGGFTGTQTLGTATFTAQQTGVATISVLPASETFGSQGGNTLVGPYGSAQITVGGAPATTQTVTTTTGPARTTTTVTTAPSRSTNTTNTTVSATTTGTAQTASATTTNNAAQAAAVGETNAGTGSVPTWAWVLGALVVLGLAGWAYYSYSKKA